MDRCSDEQMDIDRQTDGLVDRNGWTVEQTDAQTYGRTEGLIE
jgi:hypothetical protein